LFQAGLWVVPVALVVRNGIVNHVATVKDPSQPPETRCGV